MNVPIAPPAPLQTRMRKLRVGPLEVMVAEAADVDAAIDSAIAHALPAPYGAVTWGAAVVVAEIVRQQVGPSMSVLDVGVGTGLVSSVAAMRGAEVLGVDIDGVALTLARETAAANHVTVRTEFFDVTAAAPLPKADVVVVADLLYETELAVAVARRVVEALALGARVIVGDPGRDGRRAFEAQLAASGVKAHFVDHVVPAFDSERETSVGIAEWSS